MRQWIKLIYKNLSNARFVINYLYFEHWNWNFIFYIYPYRMRISHILVHIQRSLQIFSSVNKKNYCKIVITSTSASLAYIWLHMSSCSQMSCNQPIPMCQDMSQLSKHGCEWKYGVGLLCRTTRTLPHLAIRVHPTLLLLSISKGLLRDCEIFANLCLKLYHSLLTPTWCCDPLATRSGGNCGPPPVPGPQ